MAGGKTGGLTLAPNGREDYVVGSSDKGLAIRTFLAHETWQEDLKAVQDLRE